MTGERTVGGYRLLRVIGEGGMGVVHLALDPSDRAVAVKVVRPHVAADPETRARLAREVRSLLRVRHPRVAEVLDADFSAELPYVVMRYVPGEALDAAVKRGMPAANSGARTVARPNAQMRPPSICWRTSCGLTIRPQSTAANNRCS